MGSPATYFAYGGPGGGNSVIVTTDGGKHWWQAYLPGTPLAVVYSQVSTPRQLVALEQLGPGKSSTCVSKDGGRHWHRSNGPF